MPCWNGWITAIHNFHNHHFKTEIEGFVVTEVTESANFYFDLLGSTDLTCRVWKYLKKSNKANEWL